MASLLPSLRRVVLHAPAARSFICSRCLSQTTPRVPSSNLRFSSWPAPKPPSQRITSRSAIFKILRWRQYATTSPTAPSPLPSLDASLEANPKETTSTTQSPPNLASSDDATGGRTTSRGVAYWLLGSAASVFGIVVLGGLTRLTESGISITEWRPVTGTLPPLTPTEWSSEFAKYRASPEFHLLNPHMTLDEFKKIYAMEWAHRLWGRFIGLSFVLPTIYLVARRRVSPAMALNLVGISALIGFQGFLGWWMVKSGLRDDLFAPGSHPRVSQYRLTAHLATAFVCYSWMLLSGLSVLRARRLLKGPPTAAATATAASAAVAAARSPALAVFRRCAAGLVGLVFLTAMSGGLVAGLDAGLIYNEFPRMGLGLVPPAAELWDTFYSRRSDASDLWWRNMLENPSTVQMDHRILATTTFVAVLALFAFSRSPRVAAALPAPARRAATAIVHLVFLQAALGISTLVYLVPVPLAAAHQAGSLALLTGALVLAHRLHMPRSTLRLVERRLKQQLPK